jgi:uncharacterized protein (TIGR00251 family)
MVAMARVAVIVSPGASRSEIVGRHGNAWKARVAAPAERGRANDALVELLGAALGLPPRDVAVIAGASGRRKLVEAPGLSVEEIERRLSTATSR